MDRIFGKNDEQLTATVEDIFITEKGSEPMRRADEIEVVEGCGIRGDRYCEGTGFWMQYGDVCQVTLISAEDLDYMESELNVRVKDGQHRRNIVVRGLEDLMKLRRRRFRVGEALFEFDRSRPPCRYIQTLTEPGMTRALRNRGGICVKVIKAGKIKPGDILKTV